MSATTSAACACCFGLGVAAAIWRHLKADRRAQQRYEALATTDAVDSDDDDEEFLDVDMGSDGAGGTHRDADVDVAISAAADADLLDFPGTATSSVVDVAATPEGRPSTMSATSASWVDEMNAELAEVWRAAHRICALVPALRVCLLSHTRLLLLGSLYSTLVWALLAV